MKKITKLLSISLICGTFFMMSGCTPNLRDIKMSQLTGEQEEQVLKKLTKEEQTLLASYQIRTAFGEMGVLFNEFSNAITGQKPTTEQIEKRKTLEDLSINEAIQAQRAFESGK